MPKDTHTQHRLDLTNGRTTHCSPCRERWIARNPKPQGIKLVSPPRATLFEMMNPKSHNEARKDRNREILRQYNEGVRSQEIAANVKRMFPKQSVTYAIVKNVIYDAIANGKSEMRRQRAEAQAN